MQPEKYPRKTGQVKSFTVLSEDFPSLGSLPKIRINTEFSFFPTQELSFFLHSIDLHVTAQMILFMGVLALQVTFSCFVCFFWLVGWLQVENQ